MINGHEYDKGYYLADDIYPTRSTFVKIIRNPVGETHCHFAKRQEVVRKDVERAFGVLQARWDVVRYPIGVQTRAERRGQSTAGG